jgi:tyrosyl-tRNA synthetase
MLERDDFKTRFKAEESIAIHEFLYPLCQGYDSVALRADVELGGTDQRFNLLVGRDLQRAFGQQPQCIMTVPILEGLDGIQKMSKSLNNYIAVEDPPREMFGKTMRLSDELMVKYYRLLTDKSEDQLKALERDLASGAKHPRDAKVELAEYFVTRFHSAAAAASARAEFERMFVDKGVPDDVPVHRMGTGGRWALLDLMVDLKLCASKSEARRLVEGGGVSLDGDKIVDPGLKLELPMGDYILKVGKKRFVKLQVSAS